MAANNNYSLAIPVSQALNDPAAAAVASDAPAIAANAPRALGDLTNCLRETKRRKMIKDNPPALATVTSDEVAESKIREIAVATELAAGKYAEHAGTPLWAQNLMARFTNLEARRANASKRDDDPLDPLCKTNGGNGPPLPVPGHVHLVLPGPPAPTGTPYPNFPQTYNDLNGMEHADIAALAAWANETFGIVAADGLAIRRNKFRRFVSD